MNKDERNAVRILHKMIDTIPFVSYDVRRIEIGAMTKRLKSNDREVLKHLKSSNIQDRVKF